MGLCVSFVLISVSYLKGKESFRSMEFEQGGSD
jgi:hypothetical protein